MIRRRLAIALALTTTLVLAACGDDDSPPPPSDGGADTGVLDLGDDAQVDDDAGPVDAGTQDGGAEDAGEGDAGVDPLPAIVTPAAHRVPASADGHDRYYGVAFAPDSSFYVTGTWQTGTAATDDVETVVAHFGADGELDTTFGTGGFVRQNLVVGANGELARGIVLQAVGANAGKIVVSATIDHLGGDARDRDVAAFRLNTDGTLDTTFGVDGVAVLDLSVGEVVGAGFVADSTYGLAVDATDRLVLSGSRKRDDHSDSDFAVLRLAANGALDDTFATAGVFSLDIDEVNASARGVSIVAGGGIVASGYFAPPSGAGAIAPVLFKLNTDGVLDTTFATGGIYSSVVLAAQTEVYGVAVERDGSLVTVGYGRPDTGGDNDWLSLRFSSTGVRDLSYGMDGVALLGGFELGDNARALITLPDDGVLLLGALRVPAAGIAAGVQDAAIALLTADGLPATSFSTDGVELVDFGGAADHFWAAALSPSGARVVVVGIATGAAGTDDDGAVWLMRTPAATIAP